MPSTASILGTGTFQQVTTARVFPFCPARELLEPSPRNTIRILFVVRNGNGLRWFTFDKSPHVTF
jgi:hypothetical protein